MIFRSPSMWVYKLQPDLESLAMGTTNDNEHSFITVYKWVTGQDHVVGCKQQKKHRFAIKSSRQQVHLVSHSWGRRHFFINLFSGFLPPFLCNMHVVAQWTICLIECVSCKSIDPPSSFSDLDVICFHLDALDVRGHCS